MTIWLGGRINLHLPTVADRVPDTVVEQSRVVLKVIQPESKSRTSTTLHQVHEFWKSPFKCFSSSDWHLLHCLNLTKITPGGKAA